MASFKSGAQPKPITIDKFLGLNQSVGDTEVKQGEAIFMENFRVTPNYKLEKRSGHKTFIDEAQTTKVIQGMWYGKIGADQVLIYVCNGQVKKKVMPSGATTTLGTMTDARTRMIYFGGKLLFQNGYEYKYYDGTTFADVSTIAYVPTLAVATPPAGGGTLLDEINLLSAKRIQVFIGNGTATVYQLLETNLDAAALIVKVNGVVKTLTTDYSVNRTTGQVTFVVAPAAQADVSIQWEKASASNVDAVVKNMASVVFGPGNGTTLFMWGNPNLKNRRTYSGVLDPTYWPANNFTLIGTDQTAITDMIPQQSNLMVFKEERAYYSTAQLNPLTNTYDYPVYDLNYAIGNACFDGVQILNDTPYTLYNRNMYAWALTYTESERSAQPVSDRMSVSFDEIDFTQAVTYDHQKNEELWINVGDRVYIYNYGNDTFYIYTNVTANCFLEIDGKMYYGDKSGKIQVFDGSLNDNNVAVNAVWKSGFMDFGSYERYKNSPYMWPAIQPATRTSLTIKCPTNRKNEDDPTLKVFKTEYKFFDFNDIDFSDFSFKTNRNPQPKRIKINAKKYAYIQFVLSNNEIDETLVVLSFKVLAEANSFTK